ncbi:hypothetical protein KPL76_01915 [Subtercola sp. PAMC28395]|uniref:hypothetical protein n=1 Tax=Subtercola sp. PAMC28395 TaxID=2846775 RepID=UPI001C0E465D|nr:hypothetical protein [Subtercola sp. PAMC28395]QWT24208.1 hypothetical protein KPL76_01915 [Subtercola sp. PAMC28395]
MPASVNIPINGSSASFTPSSFVSRAKKLYVNGNVTDGFKLDAKNRPLFGFKAIVEVLGQRLEEVSVESTMELPSSLPLGVVLVGSGVGEIRIRNTREGFDLGITVFLETFAIRKGGE